MSSPAPSLPAQPQALFLRKNSALPNAFSNTRLGEALAAGGDYADLYFEAVRPATSLGVDQSSSPPSQGNSAGCDSAVLSGEHTATPIPTPQNPRPKPQNP